MVSGAGSMPVISAVGESAHSSIDQPCQRDWLAQQVTTGNPLRMFSFFTTAKSFRNNKLIGSPLLNKAGLHILRKRAAAFVALVWRSLTGWRLPADQRRVFDRQGFLSVPDFLPAAQLAAIKQELLSASWPTLEMSQPPATTLRVNLDAKLCGTQFPALRQLLSNTALRRWLSYTAGCPGVPIISVQLIHTDGVSAGHDEQTDWHRDTFHSVAKAWLFLHDVPADKGPFGYCPGSHKPTASHWEWEYQQSILAHAEPNAMHSHGSFRIDSAGLEQLGYPATYVATVPANTMIVADTSGFHRRTPSQQPGIRIEIYATLRRNPFFGWLFPSLLSLPWVRSHWAGWLYRYSQRMHARGTPDWIPLGNRVLTEGERALLVNLQEN